MDNTKPKKNRRPVSIQWKVFLFLLGFCFLLLVILWLFQTVFLQSFYTAIKLADVGKEAKSLAALVEGGDRETFEETVRRRGDLRVVLWSESAGSTQVEGVFSEIGLPGLDDEQKAALYRQTQENGGALSMRYTLDEEPFAPPPSTGQTPHMPTQQDAKPPENAGHRKNEWVLHAQIVNTESGTQLLLVSAAITPVNATVDTLRIQLLIISAIMVVLAALLALVLAKRVAKPIQALNQSAKELGKGNYTTAFSAGGYREIGELSQTLTAAAAELSKTEALRQELIANVSHDLRTPLTLIGGYAEMMRDIPGENTPENMQVIIDETNHLSSLVGDLLDLSRLQSGTAQMHLQPLNLTAEVRGIISRFQKLSATEGYSVGFEADSDVWVQADEVRISQVVYNFLVNAMVHGGADKQILVRQSSSGARVRIEVSDHGEGIAPDMLPYIWDRYYKVDKAHRRAAVGSGLGLSIVKTILQQHPGVEYGAESAPAEGSTFWFSLPIVPGPQPANR